MRNEAKGKGVDTVTGVLRGKAFTLKDMAQMGITMRALDLGTESVRVGNSSDGIGKVLVETGPATVGIKLAFG